MQLPPFDLKGQSDEQQLRHAIDKMHKETSNPHQHEHWKDQVLRLARWMPGTRVKIRVSDHKTEDVSLSKATNYKSVAVMTDDGSVRIMPPTAILEVVLG